MRSKYSIDKEAIKEAWKQEGNWLIYLASVVIYSIIVKIITDNLDFWLGLFITSLFVLTLRLFFGWFEKRLKNE